MNDCFHYPLQHFCLRFIVDIMDLLSNIDESQWKNEEPKNIQGTLWHIRR